MFPSLVAVTNYSCGVSRAPNRIFVARLAGTSVFDPMGDKVGRVHDVVVLIRLKGPPRAVGMVIEVRGRRRVFLPFTRVTAIDAGAVITTGLVNMRRFEQRSAETLVMGELLDRRLQLRDDSGTVTVQDVALEQRKREWLATQLFVRRTATGMFKRGETLLVDVGDVTGLAGTGNAQGAAALLATMDDLKAADLADVLSGLPDTRRLQVAAELPDERLADVLAELGTDDRVSIVTALPTDRAARVLESMQPDDATDLYNELPGALAGLLLGRMDPEEAADIRRLLAYDEHTAGGLMTTEPIILPPEASAATALAHARNQDVTPALAAMIFVVRPPLETPTGKLLGVAHLQRLLREPPHQAIGTILDTDIEALGADDKHGTVMRLMATYNLTALPVADDEGHLLGAVSVDDVLDKTLPEDWRDVDEAVIDAAMEATRYDS